MRLTCKISLEKELHFRSTDILSLLSSSINKATQVQTSVYTAKNALIILIHSAYMSHLEAIGTHALGHIVQA